MNKFDGLYHAKNGKIYDGAGKEVVQQLSQAQKQDWCDSGIKGTNWCAAEEAADLNERTKQQKGLMFAQGKKQDWCDSGIKGTNWCANEEAKDLNERTKQQ